MKARLLFANQYAWPDAAATAQLLADLVGPCRGAGAECPGHGWGPVPPRGCNLRTKMHWLVMGEWVVGRTDAVSSKISNQ